MVLSRAQPQRRTRVSIKNLKNAIKHATNLCINYEDTKECKLAWEQIDELTDELDRQQEEEIQRRVDEKTVLLSDLQNNDY